VLDAFHEAIVALSQTPAMGHTRMDLTERRLKFWSVYSYLLVYDPESRPLTVIAVLHAARNVRRLLKNK
jgi:antitoxin ParD1/3/4/toxin ParE1/3/4